MKKFLVVLYLTLVGCDFTVPLHQVADTSIDRQAVGLWERTKSDGTTEQLLVLPLNDHEYILSWPSFNCSGWAHRMVRLSKMIGYIKSPATPSMTPPWIYACLTRV